MNTKIIAAHAQITEILRKYDLGAFVLLHSAPGATDVFMQLNPTYSRLIVKPDEAGQINCNVNMELAEYGGNANAQLVDLFATANMADSFAVQLTKGAEMMQSIANHIHTVLPQPLVTENAPSESPAS